MVHICIIRVFNALSRDYGNTRGGWECGKSAVARWLKLFWRFRLTPSVKSSIMTSRCRVRVYSHSPIYQFTVAREMMMRARKWCLGLLVFIVASPLMGQEGHDVQEPKTLLSLSSIGFPTALKKKDAWKVNDLKIFKRKLYVGSGDAVVNTGPTDVIYFDLHKNRFFTEFTVDDEAIYRYQVIDGKLVIPGADATEDWERGNIYVLNEGGWTKKRTIIHGIHVNRIAPFGGHWYAATGSFFELEKDSIYAFGGIFCSGNEGDSWKLVYATPCDDRSVFRIGSLISFQGKLYAFPYAYRSITEDEIPSEQRSFLSEMYGDRYLVFIDDPLGKSDVLAFDGNSWTYIDLISAPHVCLTSPFIFKERLILSHLHGTYVDYLAWGKRFADNVQSVLHAFDGEQFTQLDIDFDLIRDVVITEEQLLLLIVAGGEYRIAMTKDLDAWSYYVFPRSLSTPLSIEFDGMTFYVGTEDGNIFKSVGTKKLLDDAVPNEHVLKFHGAAELPRSGKWYWAAIREWERWGKLAQFSCGVRKGNIIDITTENVSALSIFIPFPEIDSTKAVEVRVNNNEAFKEKLNGATEILIEKQEGIMWNAERRDGTEQHFHYSKRLMGTSMLALTSEGIDAPLGSFIADAISYAVSADAAIIPRSGLLQEIPAGEVFLEDLFDAFHRDTIFTFRVKGADLYRMMEFNIALEAKYRCQIAGFTFTFRRGNGAGKNSIVTSSIDPAKTYVVATTSFLARRMERFLGKDTNCTDSSISVQEGMMQWFKKFKQVNMIEQRIFAIE